MWRSVCLTIFWMPIQQKHTPSEWLFSVFDGRVMCFSRSFLFYLFSWASLPTYKIAKNTRSTGGGGRGLTKHEHKPLEQLFDELVLSQYYRTLCSCWYPIQRILQMPKTRKNWGVKSVFYLFSWSTLQRCCLDWNLCPYYLNFRKLQLVSKKKKDQVPVYVLAS